MSNISRFAYDPQRTVIAFEGERIKGFAADTKYAKGATAGTHVLYLQPTSPSFDTLLVVGNRGTLTVQVHRGGAVDNVLNLHIGYVKVVGYSVSRLSNEVPTVSVILREVNA